MIEICSRLKDVENMDHENELQLNPEDEAKLDRFPVVMQQILQFASNMKPKRSDEVLVLIRNLLTTDISVDKFLNDLEAIINVQLQGSIVVEFLHRVIAIIRKSGSIHSSLIERLADFIKEEKLPTPARRTTKNRNGVATKMGERKVKAKATFFPPIGDINDVEPTSGMEQQVPVEVSQSSLPRPFPWQGFNPFKPISPDNPPPIANQISISAMPKSRPRKRKISAEKKTSSPTMVKMETDSNVINEFCIPDAGVDSANTSSDDKASNIQENFSSWADMHKEWLSWQMNIQAAYQQMLQQQTNYNTTYGFQSVLPGNSGNSGGKKKKSVSKAAKIPKETKKKPAGLPIAAAEVKPIEHIDATQDMLKEKILNSEIHFDRKETCENCGQKALHVCGKCKLARYCSQFCQNRDWMWHRMKCRLQQPSTSNANSKI